eukprot:2575648-Pyramimonas_sp.AAC.1
MRSERVRAQRAGCVRLPARPRLGHGLLGHGQILRAHLALGAVACHPARRVRRRALAVPVLLLPRAPAR